MRPVELHIPRDPRHKVVRAWVDVTSERSGCDDDIHLGVEIEGGGVIEIAGAVMSSGQTVVRLRVVGKERRP